MSSRKEEIDKRAGLGEYYELDLRHLTWYLKYLLETRLGPLRVCRGRS